MRVNVYAEEITNRVEIVEKNGFTGVRFYLELPVSLSTPPTGLAPHTAGMTQMRGPFVHGPGDDDSAAVTFWGKRELRSALQSAIRLLDEIEKSNAATPKSRQPDALAAAREGIGYAIQSARGSTFDRADVKAMEEKIDELRGVIRGAARP